MIPKIIHYCWFGGNPLPEDAKRYIATWKKYCPDYEIREWNEHNFDVTQNTYCYEAYKAKKWAFVTDYVRLKVLHDCGGIYMDTDVEVCKALDPFLRYSAFSGFETENKIPTGILGSQKEGGWITYLLSYYDTKHFNLNGKMDLTTNVSTISQMTKDKYDIKLDNTFQIFGENNVIFPFEYFCAKDMMDGKIKSTNNTYTVHHFAGSWLPWHRRVRHQVKIILVKVFGVDFVNKLRKVLLKERIIQ